MTSMEQATSFLQRVARVATISVGRHAPFAGSLIVLVASALLLRAVPAHAQGDGATWRLSAQPVLTIGGVNGPPDQLFTSIAGALRLRDGRYVVADGRELRISVHDRNGRLQAGFGRPGGGPGEYRSLRGLWLAGGDTIAVWDAQAARITRLLPDGTVAGTHPLAFPPNAARARQDPFYGVLRDGSVVLAGISFGPQGADGLQPDRMTFGVFDAAGSFRFRLGTHNGMSRVFTESGSGPHAFSPFPWGAVVRDTFVYTNGVNGEIHFYATSAAGDGPVRTLRVTGTAPSMRDAWSALDRALAAATVNRFVVAYTRETDRTSGVVPRFAKMLADDRGRVWLKEYDPATDAIAIGAGRAGGRWRIIETSGRAVAHIALPRGVSPLAVYGDDLLAVARDELDVQSFVVYRIQR